MGVDRVEGVRYIADSLLDLSNRRRPEDTEQGHRPSLSTLEPTILVGFGVGWVHFNVMQLGLSMHAYTSAHDDRWLWLDDVLDSYRRGLLKRMVAHMAGLIRTTPCKCRAR